MDDISPCKKCGECGILRECYNPKSDRTEYWVSPQRISKCRFYLKGLQRVCQSDSYYSRNWAVDNWNKAQRITE